MFIFRTRVFSLWRASCWYYLSHVYLFARRLNARSPTSSGWWNFCTKTRRRWTCSRISCIPSSPAASTSLTRISTWQQTWAGRIGTAVAGVLPIWGGTGTGKCTIWIVPRALGGWSSHTTRTASRAYLDRPSAAAADATTLKATDHQMTFLQGLRVDRSTCGRQCCAKLGRSLQTNVPTESIRKRLLLDVHVLYCT